MDYTTEFELDVRYRDFTAGRETMNTLTKQPTEIVTYTMNFLYAISTGDALSAVTSVTASPTGGVTITSPSLKIEQSTPTLIYTTAPVIQFTVAGGTNGTIYEITATVTTVNGETLVGVGLLNVAVS